MTTPARIRIGRGKQTGFVGRYGGDGNQFLSLVAPLAGAPGGPRHWYAVLHRFDGEGNHLDTRAFRSGREGDPGAERQAAQTQAEWIRQLSTLLLGAIEVKPFRAESEGLAFALAAAPEQDVVRFDPYGLAFRAPWDGHYEGP